MMLYILWRLKIQAEHLFKRHLPVISSSRQSITVWSAYTGQFDLVGQWTDKQKDVVSEEGGKRDSPNSKIHLDLGDLPDVEEGAEGEGGDVGFAPPAGLRLQVLLVLDPTRLFDPLQRRQNSMFMKL